MKDSVPEIVDNAKDDIKYNYEYKFRRVFGDLIEKDLLRFCIYSITLNDPAHNLDHVLNVSKTGMELYNHYKGVHNFNYFDSIIVSHALLMHDLGCKYNRDDHHLIGYGLVYEYLARYAPNVHSTEVVKSIAECVLEHRSSNKNKPSNILSEIVSVADSGKPDLHLYLDRALRFRLSGKTKKEYSNREELFKEVLEHLEEKYGENGYNWESYPDIGLNYYNDEWEVFKTMLKDNVGNSAYLNLKYEEYREFKWNLHKGL